MAKKSSTTADAGEVLDGHGNQVELAESPDGILQLLESMGQAVVSTPEEVSMAILERIMRAETPEQLLAPQGTTHAKDVLGRRITIMGAHFLQSTIEGDGPGVYAVLDCLVDGEPMAITCGARTVLIQVLKAKNADWLPMVCKIEQSTMKTAAGFYPMWLAAVVPGDDDGAEETDEESF